MMDCKWADVPLKLSILRIRVTSWLHCPLGLSRTAEELASSQPVLRCFVAAGGTCPGLPFAPSVSQVGSTHGGLKPRLTLLSGV